MPVIVTKGTQDYYLVPAPLVTFNKQVYNNVGRPGFGSDFSVSLQGTLIQTHGNPYYTSGSGSLSTDAWTKTAQVETNEIQDVSGLSRLDATIIKQELIRNLFSNPVISGEAAPLKITVRGWDAASNNEGGSPTANSGISFYGFVDDISFDSDGRWANPGSYTVNLRGVNFIKSANSSTFQNGYNENIPSGSGYFISSLTDNIDIQEDGRTTLVFKNVGGGFDQKQELDRASKVYTINRSITAVGSPVYNESGSYLNNLRPWQQASGFLHSYLKLGSGTSGTLSNIQSKHQAISMIGSGYNVSNLVYQESIDREAGTYSITETFILYSGGYPVIETITINQDFGENDTRAISVQGTIQGLNTCSGFVSSGNAYQNAWSYFTGVIDTGVPATPFYYARGLMRGIADNNRANPSWVPWLHPRPLTRSVASDFGAGTVSYTYNYDDRPANIVPGSISESIQINDTYPGELFSVTPVIGRSQPVLQYLNSRSEYKRTLSISITMAQTGDPSNYGVNNFGEIPLSTNRRFLLQRILLNEKPSISQTAALNDIFQAANPVNDPYFSVAEGKCFHSAPTENWDPRTRNYSYNIEWTYERL